MLERPIIFWRRMGICVLAIEIRSTRPQEFRMSCTAHNLQIDSYATLHTDRYHVSCWLGILITTRGREPRTTTSATQNTRRKAHWKT